MPSAHSWDDPPAKRSRDFFVEAIQDHTKVRVVVAETTQRYRIQRHGLSDVLVFLTNVYTLGIADYLAARRANPDADCVVTLSGHNRYTDEAKSKGIEDGVGVFKFGELYGALHKEGDDFFLHEPQQ
jgi:hypothetical protein